jgi:predicted nicotinamide N-methyase
MTTDHRANAGSVDGRQPAVPSIFPPHLAHLRIPVPLPVLDGTATDEDLTWAYPWPGGLRLSAGLDGVVDCRGLRVADLGCGRGHLGFTALTQGAVTVVFADASRTALDFVDAVATANGMEPRMTCAPHTWGDVIPGAPFDLILGGDILYRPAFFGRLLASIADSLAPAGHALLSDPRVALDEELPALAAGAGLSWRILRQEAGWGTVVRADLR